MTPDIRNLGERVRMAYEADERAKTAPLALVSLDGGVTVRATTDSLDERAYLAESARDRRDGGEACIVTNGRRALVFQPGERAEEIAVGDATLSPETTWLDWGEA